MWEGAIMVERFSRSEAAMGNGACWPTSEQQLLLRTLIAADPASARRSWREWRERADVEALDPGSLRLLPTLCRRLVALRIDDPLLGRIRGLWRRAWYQNARRVVHLRELVEALRARGIESMLIKGLALALTVYRDLGERPMSDVDLLVPTGAASRALEVLAGLGMESLSPRPKALIRVLHGVGLRRRDGFELDLHWHSAKDFCAGGVDQAMWARRRPLVLRGVPAQVPSPTHLLLQSVVHGVQWNVVPPVRWIADAAMILRGDDGVDWAEIVRLAEESECSLVVSRGLRHLGEYSLPVPERVVAHLERRPSSPLERYEMRLRQAPGGGGLLGNLPRTLLHYRRLSGGRSPVQRIVGLPGFLRDWWQLESGAQLPVVLARKAAGRLRGKDAARQTATEQ
jgi:hypothetical protein